MNGLGEILGPGADLSGYQAAARNLADNPNSPEARRALEVETSKLIMANRGNPAVEALIAGAGISVPASGSFSAEEVTVTGSRDYLIGSVVDRSGIWVGEQEQSLGSAVGEFIQENPGAGLALRIADTAFAAIAPTKYLAGRALDYFKDEASGWVADKMEGPRLWSTEKAEAGGKGFVLAGSVLLSGLAAIKGGIALKPVNLPSWKRVGIDIDHIRSGHMFGGSRVSELKSMFPENMTARQVQRSVREAYRNGNRVTTNGDRVLVRGWSDGLGIEMWVNTKTRLIETAYPFDSAH